MNYTALAFLLFIINGWIPSLVWNSFSRGVEANEILHRYTEAQVDQARETVHAGLWVLNNFCHIVIVIALVKAL